MQSASSGRATCPLATTAGSRTGVAVSPGYRAKQECVCVRNLVPCSFQAEVSAGLAGPPPFAADDILAAVAAGPCRAGCDDRLTRLSVVSWVDAEAVVGKPLADLMSARCRPPSGR